MPPPSVMTHKGLVYARLLGAMADHESAWETGVLSSEFPREEHYVTASSFAIGRQEVAGMQTIIVKDSRVSRKAATIAFHEGKREWVITALNSNGVDVNQNRLATGGSASLPSRSTVRVGPFYFYFLLPAAGSVDDGAAAAAAGVTKPRFKPSKPVTTLIELAVKKRLRDDGDVRSYLSTLEVERWVKEEFAAEAFPEDVRNVLNRALRSKGLLARYEELPADHVPEDVLAAYARTHPTAKQKQKLWWRRRSDAEAAAFVPAAPAGAGEEEEV